MHTISLGPALGIYRSKRKQFEGNLGARITPSYGMTWDLQEAARNISPKLVLRDLVIPNGRKQTRLLFVPIAGDVRNFAKSAVGHKVQRLAILE